jgi:hypothetical protein
VTVWVPPPEARVVWVPPSEAKVVEPAEAIEPLRIEGQTDQSSPRLTPSAEIAAEPRDDVPGAIKLRIPVGSTTTLVAPSLPAGAVMSPVSAFPAQAADGTSGRPSWVGRRARGLSGLRLR